MPAERRFPPPWSVEEQAACFVVRDHNGQRFAYILHELRQLKLRQHTLAGPSR